MATKNTVSRLAVLCASAIVAIGGMGSSAYADTAKGLSKDEVNALIKEYILGNPEIIIESLENHEIDQRRKEAEMAAKALTERKEDLFADENSPSIGPDDADITIVEFFDYNCGYCKKALADLNEVLKDDDNIRVVFKEFPVLSPASRTAALWGLAADKQGKYFEFHQELMKHRGNKDEAAMSKVAESVGLDVDKLKADAGSAETEAILMEMRELGVALGIRGTPGFVINDQVYPGWIPADRMKAEIKKKREAMQ